MTRFVVELINSMLRAFVVTILLGFSALLLGTVLLIAVTDDGHGFYRITGVSK